MPKKSGTNTGKGRFYRKLVERAGERSFQVVVGQSDLWITVAASAPETLEETALQRVTELRGQIHAWMILDPEFGESLVPVAARPGAPEVIRRMCSASRIMGVGPMACVAGAVAGCTAETLLPWSSECIVENGGDIMLHSSKERVVAMLSETEGGTRIGLRLQKEDFPVSVCASSSFIGHSLSLGRGELAVVRSPDPFLADAAATAFCNMLKSAEDASKVAEQAALYADAGVEGVFLQCGGNIGIWGRMELTGL